MNEDPWDLDPDLPFHPYVACPDGGCKLPANHARDSTRQAYLDHRDALYWLKWALDTLSDETRREYYADRKAAARHFLQQQTAALPQPAEDQEADDAEARAPGNFV